MFESAELGHKLDKSVWQEEVPQLREQLLLAQMEMVESAGFSVIIILSGMDGAGKGETLSLLNQWLDPRHVQTNAMGPPSDEELERPPMWRFWRALPPKGKIGVFVESWYKAPIWERALGKTGNSELDQAMERNNRFEKMLADEGVLLLKYWLHLSKDCQKTIFRKLEKNPDTRWRVTETDWKYHKKYDLIRRAAGHALRQTSTAHAPWTIVEGADPRYRHLTIGKSLLQSLQRRLAANGSSRTDVNPPPLIPAIDNLHLLRALKLGQVMDKKAYNLELEKYQGRLNLLTRHPGFKDLSVVAVFEGYDAAGKGGAIRRVAGALDARKFRIIPIAAPSEEERAQPYLWRFWRHLPRRGVIAVFDRSWYGRVLVERVEKYCSESDWMRAYGEINDFELQLVRNRTVILKFWLTIDKDEQLARFKERESTAFKSFKITDEDWRNREKWEDYEHAVCDMIDRTSCEIAPWTLVEGNNKYFARIKVLRTFCDRFEAALKAL